MADDKEPTQAGGASGPARAVANENDPPNTAEPDMPENAAESGEQQPGAEEAGETPNDVTGDD
jgi:hypothetical protein